MKKYLKLFVICLFTLIFFVTGAVSALAVHTRNYLLSDVYFDTNEADTYYQRLVSTSTSNLLNAVELLFDHYENMSGDNILITLQVFCERFHEYEAEEIISIIADESKDAFFRCNIVTLAYETYSEDHLDQLTLLANNVNMHEEVRIAVINELSDKTNVIDDLIDLISDPNERIGYHALKKLYNIDPSVGLKISENYVDLFSSEKYKSSIFNSKVNENISFNTNINSRVLILKAALQNISYNYSIANIDQLLDGKFLSNTKQDQFIDLCKKIIQDNSWGLRDATIFCLCEMIHPDSIRYLLESDYVSNSKKTFAVNMNFLPLTYLATKEKSQDNIVLLCNATMLRPFEDFLSILRGCDPNCLTYECQQFLESEALNRKHGSANNEELHVNYKLINR